MHSHSCLCLPSMRSLHLNALSCSPFAHSLSLPPSALCRFNHKQRPSIDYSPALCPFHSLESLHIFSYIAVVFVVVFFVFSCHRLRSEEVDKEEADATVSLALWIKIAQYYLATTMQLILKEDAEDEADELVTNNYNGTCAAWMKAKHECGTVRGVLDN